MSLSATSTPSGAAIRTFMLVALDRGVTAQLDREGGGGRPGRNDSRNGAKAR